MKKFLKRLIGFVAKLFVLLLLLSVALVIAYRFLPVPFTITMLQRCAEQFANDKPLKLKYHWVCYDSVSVQMKKAVIAAEDQKFFSHNGFDYKAIEKAVQYNEKQKQRGRAKKRGASTISQQTAKNVFLWQSRNWLRKGLEVYFTFLIEVFWSKERILEVYLNVIETGDGVYGAEAAARYYFKTGAKNLSVSQAAAIAAVLPNPRMWNAAKPSPYIQRRKNWIEKQMRHVSLSKKPLH